MPTIRRVDVVAARPGNGRDTAQCAANGSRGWSIDSTGNPPARLQVLWRMAQGVSRQDVN
jgi:hypothetical protein